MTTEFVITAMGPDRPGLVERLAATVAEHGGNWLDSRMSVLAGQFAGVTRVSVADARARELETALHALDDGELRISVSRLAEPAPATAAAPGAEPTHAAYLELMGHDRPGIVQEIARVLHERGVNIEDLVTERISGAMTGGTLFKAAAELHVPESVALETLRRDLEELANELMVEIRVRELTEEEGE